MKYTDISESNLRPSISADLFPNSYMENVISVYLGDRNVEGVSSTEVFGAKDAGRPVHQSEFHLADRKDSTSEATSINMSTLLSIFFESTGTPKDKATQVCENTLKGQTKVMEPLLNQKDNSFFLNRQDTVLSLSSESKQSQADQAELILLSVPPNSTGKSMSNQVEAYNFGTFKKEFFRGLVESYFNIN